MRRKHREHKKISRIIWKNLFLLSKKQKRNEDLFYMCGIVVQLKGQSSWLCLCRQESLPFFEFWHVRVEEEVREGNLRSLKHL